MVQLLLYFEKINYKDLQKVFDTTIPRNIRLAEAPSHGTPIGVYDASSKGAKAYLDLAEEILKRNKEKYTKISTKIKVGGTND